ncbi:anaerobic ribonucleoside-triphosphate reductase activating protein [Vagococcus zengguangii]|uniref:Anaerobic ribonucleoside-triphosphate reductase-activating protein n=1 Tax=Vagococcus zengguangii TaxID=2571750 RepID=A0A4D7CSI2_9ENTE|nr:anaerobic ribonucleoside-triphosphate reductase activating protein [Vagococcus zengguangii]QCI85854.1 anaerobic ribonucleoside-triphosphate reductase activating protein [Vagococcus zengguangii]TLG81794.1 anaerobic ribonucleoside-triphosphate reductase activating protein [Vagococcus zengguangii]
MRNPQPKEWLSSDYSQCYYADYKPFNFVDGEGVRCSLYVSGCLFACEGCYNKAVQSFRYGQPYTAEVEVQILSDLEQTYCQGLTLLGGEPFLNTDICLPLVKKVREQFGTSKDIWAWSGYTFEELMKESDDKLALLSEIDVLVDGRFELSKKDLKLQFRGSSNQRIIDVPKSLAQKQVVIWEKCFDANENYEQIKRV